MIMRYSIHSSQIFYTLDINKSNEKKNSLDENLTTVDNHGPLFVTFTTVNKVLAAPFSGSRLTHYYSNSNLITPYVGQSHSKIHF